jgi:hypothetical protein
MNYFYNNYYTITLGYNISGSGLVQLYFIIIFYKINLLLNKGDIIIYNV